MANTSTMATATTKTAKISRELLSIIINITRETVIKTQRDSDAASDGVLGPGPVLCRHQFQHPLDCDCGGSRTEFVVDMDYRRTDVLRAAVVLCPPFVCHESGRRRSVRLEPKGIRRFCRLHYRLELLGIEPAVLSQPSLFRRRQRSVYGRGFL